MMDQPMIFVRRLFSRAGRRPRRGFTPAVRPLEGRRLLSAVSTASATMTQTATFPDLESYPTVSNQALLYFSTTMGTLTEVDVVTSGSFQSQFSAENLGSSGSTITGTTTGNLAIDVPTGAVPVTIPAVSESFHAAPFDGTLKDGGPSGKTFAPATSSSAPQTTVLTSPAALAAFTGQYRIPISVTGHATGSVVSSNGKASGAFQTDTAATITVIYHYIPNSSSVDPAAESAPGSAGSGTNAALISATGAVAGTGRDRAAIVGSEASSTHAGKHGSSRTRIASQHRHLPRQLDVARRRPAQFDVVHRHGPGRIIAS
jgi:hypothetical protein